MSSTSNTQKNASSDVKIPLLNQLAGHILHYNAKFGNEDDSGQNVPLFQSTIAIAGGGSGALSSITATPGASSFLLEGIITYDRISFANFLTSPPLIKSGVFRKTNMNVDSLPHDFKFSSRLAAEYLAQASLQKSLEYILSKTESSKQDINQVYESMDHCIGIGCASMLSSTPGSRKSKQQPHGHVCIMYPDGSKDFLSCILYPSSSLNDQSIDPFMIRKDQDDRLSSVVLLSILTSIRNRLCQYMNDGSILDVKEGNDALSHLNDIIQNAVLDLTKGNSLEPETSLSPIPLPLKHFDIIMRKDNTELVTKKTQEVLNRVKQSNVLLPKVNMAQHVNDEAKHIYNSFQDAVIPTDSLIFPGSFNPMHVGHISLAHAALKVMMEKRQNEYQEHQKHNSSAEKGDQYSIWDFAHSKHKVDTQPSSPPPPAIFFEMSIANADKASMDLSQIEERAIWMLTEMTKYTTQDDNDDAKMTIPLWGVLLDSAPLFFQKVQLVEQLITPFHPPISTNNERKMTFVIGTDTLVRILHPKYYDHNNEKMLAAIRDMKSRGVHFVVGGRSEQGKATKEGGLAPKFIDGSKEVAEQPADVREMFTLLKEEDFRVDLSSTEIRNKLALQ